MAIKIQGTTVIDDSRVLKDITVDSAVTLAIGQLTPSGILGNTIISNGSEYITSDSSTAAILVPAGTTAERPGSPVNGYIRYNTDESEFEGYANSQWGAIGGGVAEAGGAILVNATTATQNYTFGAGYNGFSVGPITVADGVTISVASGQRWVII